MTEKMHVTVEWLAAHTLPAVPSISARDKYFESASHTSIFSQHGIPRSLWLAPARWLPLQGFHKLATSRAPGFAEEGVRLPYQSVELGSEHQGRVTAVSTELFPGQMVLTRVAAKVDVPLKEGLDSALASLGTLRSGKEVPAVDHLVKTIAGFIGGQPRRAVADLSYDCFFTMKVQLPTPSTGFDAAIEESRGALVALLIGSNNAEMLTGEIVDRVWSANSELNVKAACELLLLNRKGFLYVIPSGQYRGPHLHRYERTRDLAVLAVYAKEFLREGHAFASQDGSDAADVVRRMSQWIRHPTTTFDASVSHTWTWVTLSQQLLLSERLDAWREYFGAADVS